MGMAKRQDSGHFPKDFRWGAAEAAYQAEGGNTGSDWYEWQVDHHGTPATGIATDFWNRYGEDLGLAKELGHNAFRMSIEWSRVEPEEGSFDEAAFEHYREILKTAHADGLEVFLTLHHFTTPLWLTHRGGWLAKDAPDAFARFTAKVVDELGTQVDAWITLNEPNVRILTGYVVGVGPPGEHDLNHAFEALAGLLKAHAQAYHVIHDRIPGAKVGFAHHMRVFMPDRWWHPVDQLLAKWVDAFWNKQILDAMTTGRLYLDVPFMAHYDEQVPGLAHTLDFVGVNYYTRDRLRFDPKLATKFTLAKPQGDVSVGGMEIYPRGFYDMLMVAGSYGLPIYVTENGIDDADDSKRGKFICEHLQELLRAIDDGADVRGYMHWALTDNWEWVSGFGLRFGLVSIDYDHGLERKVRPSAELYSRIIQEGSLEACK
jgi:beta-glucosidase